MAAFWENVNSGKLVGASQLASSLVLLFLSLSPSLSFCDQVAAASEAESSFPLCPSGRLGCQRRRCRRRRRRPRFGPDESSRDRKSQPTYGRDLFAAKVI